jgi:hypothetical protein
MKRIRVDNLGKEWMKDSGFRREYDALAEEFALVSALLSARGWARLTHRRWRSA